MAGIMQLETTFKGKKVFITGHTGFKGTWLLNILFDLGAVIKGYALQPQNDSDLFFSTDSIKKCENVVADIRNKDLLTKEILSFQPDFIFHLAAQSLVRYSYNKPLYTYEVNTIGTANLLESLKELNKPCVCIVITTDKVYENTESDVLYKEQDKLGGYDPYSASKACAEIITSSYRNSFFNKSEYKSHFKKIVTARAGNVIGGGDWNEDRIIPDIVNALKKGKEIVIRNPLSVRPWQHVLEPLIGYLTYASKLYNNESELSDSYNFGPNKEDCLQVKELVEIAIDCWGAGKYKFEKNENDLHEANLLMLDISKAKNELNWYPIINSTTAIVLTINWYKKNALSNNNALALMQADIAYYFKLLNDK